MLLKKRQLFCFPHVGANTRPFCPTCLSKWTLLPVMRCGRLRAPTGGASHQGANATSHEQELPGRAGPPATKNTQTGECSCLGSLRPRESKAVLEPPRLRYFPKLCYAFLPAAGAAAHLVLGCGMPWRRGRGFALEAGPVGGTEGFFKKTLALELTSDRRVVVSRWLPWGRLPWKAEYKQKSHFWSLLSCAYIILLHFCPPSNLMSWVRLDWSN